ncbi:recombinase family protein [Arthrobacter bambusae]
MPVAIYARISSVRDSTDTGAVERQVDMCHELLARRPELTLYANTSGDPALGGYRGAFSDTNISAYSAKRRPAWEHVEALVLDGKIDGIVAYAPDRIHRRATDMLQLIRRVSDAKRGLKLYFVRGNDHDFQSHQGRMLAGIVAVFAGAEIEQLTQRIVDQKHEAAKDGHWNGGRPPLGYQAVKKENKDGRLVSVLIKHPVIAPELEKAIDGYLGGKSLIVCLEEFRAKTGLKTEYTSFKSSLCSPSIAGQRMHFPEAARNGRSVHTLYTTPNLLENEATFYPALWEPIISIKKWRLLRNKLVNKSTRKRGKRPVKSLLAGMIFCANCGEKLGNDGTSYKIKDDPTSGIKHYPTYRCSGSNRGCGRMQIGAKLLDPFIEHEFLKVLKLSLEQNRFAPIQQSADRLLELENELTSIADTLVEDYENLSKKVVDPATYEVVRSRRLEQRAKLESELAGLTLKHSSQQQLLTALDLYDAMDTSQRREIMSTIVKRIEIRKVARRGGLQNVLDERRVSVTWEIGGREFVTYGAAINGAPVLVAQKPHGWD